ncbi:GNAT family N-acetyltransferase [Phenylobacterium sp. LH3H17]|uniref:GNAT family N-acetyltransferase n=1 Tax=Phenylobacterium sp. LH3H17 TaxID=2903901 RepID=UPI0020C93AC5|nr:GNAT family N-acetyltransferase [Phenylobacterium sp. LH3H17]UTP37809.1 GNAT family N-acetyltransferase [Phenylobacterium sp. LH3H17]
MSLRRASLADAGAIARLHRFTMQVSLPYLPELHTPEEDFWFFSERLLPECETWVVEVGEAIVGYVAYKAGWIMHLYVHPEHQGAGVGAMLLAKALEDRTSRHLWTFQQNARARRFYESRGFKLVKLTDGADNEEKTPDALYAWEA